MQEFTIDTVSTPVADAWIVGCADCDVAYSYGGTRKVPAGTSDAVIKHELVRLMRYESHLKNRLINRVLAEGALDHLAAELPAGFLGSRVGGGRCLFRPRDERVDAILSDPGHPEFEATIEVLFEQVGARLNELDGRIKLTPDFGKFSGVSDILHRHTTHVLGIRVEDGGCGGKASYTTTGIMAALEHIGIGDRLERPVTVIGADGALGVDITRDLASRGFRDLMVADLAYGEDTLAVNGSAGAAPIAVLPSEPGRFTDRCLRRGGVIVPATHGGELVASDMTAIPRGTVLALAHNLALPSGELGRQLAAELQRRCIDVIPGQVLTLGGALTSRIEWFSRAQGAARFDKPLAHAVVHATVSHLMDAIPAQDAPPPFYEQMCAYAGFDPGHED